MFTYNNFTSEGVEKLKEYAKTQCKFICFAYELGEEKKTPHLQGCLWFRLPRNTSNVNRQCKKGQRFHGYHFEAQCGSMASQREYIVNGVKDGEKKEWIEGTEPYVWGTWPTEEEYDLQRPRQGDRTDLRACWMAIHSGKRKREVEDEFLMVDARYPKWMEKHLNYAKIKSLQKPAIEVRPWQEELLKVLEAPRVDRKIYWIWSTEHETGKSTFCGDWLRAHFKFDFVELPNMKLADCFQEASKMDMPRVLYYALPKDVETECSKYVYFTLEKLSDGGLRNFGKNQGGMADLRNASVVVSSNFEPPIDKLPKRLVSCCVDPGVLNVFIEH